MGRYNCSSCGQSFKLEVERASHRKGNVKRPETMRCFDLNGKRVTSTLEPAQYQILLDKSNK